MLTLTEDVVRLIRSAVEVCGMPDGGLRIAPAPASGFEIKLAEAPETDDDTIEVVGARVFVDRSASEVFDGMVLDAEVNETGAITVLAIPQEAYAARDD